MFISKHVEDKSFISNEHPVLPVAEDRNVPVRDVALRLAKNHIIEKIKEREGLRGY